MALNPSYDKNNTRIFWGTNQTGIIPYFSGLYSSNFISSNDGWAAQNAFQTLSFNQTNFDIPFTNGWLSVVSPGAVNNLEISRNIPILVTGNTYVVQMTVDIPSTNPSGINYIGVTNISQVNHYNGQSGNIAIIPATTGMQTISGSFTYIGGASQTGVTIYWSDNSGKFVSYASAPAQMYVFLKNISISTSGYTTGYLQQEILPNMPTPLLTIDEESIMVGGNVWGMKKNIQLQGEYVLASGQQGFNLQRYLLTLLSNNFGQLYIYDNYAQSNQITVLAEPNVYVQSIDFPESRYLGIGKYNLNFYSFPSGFFTVYGVTDVKDLWTFEENGNYILNLTRTYGAKGFNTNSGINGDLYNNAYDNAYNFCVNYISGCNTNPISGSSALPQFIQTKNKTLGYQPFLVNRVETINRFGGEYSVTEQYTADLFYNQLGLLRFTIELNEPFAGFRTCEIKGDFIGSRDAGFAVLRSAFLAFDFTDTALTSEPLLNPATLEKTVSENQLSREIKFSFKYNTDKQPNIIQNITTSVNALIDITKVSVEGEIVAKKMSYVGWSGVSGAFQNLNIYDIAATEYATFYSGAGNAPLNITPESKTYTENINENKINFSYTFNNNLSLSTGFEIMTVKQDVKVPVRKINPSLTLDNMGYYFTDLGIDTPQEIKTTINGIAVETISDSVAESIISSILTGYVSGNGNLVADTQTINNQKQFARSQTYIYPTQASLTNFSGVQL